MKIDLKKLEEQKKKNFEERLRFIDFWADYVRTHSDKEWSEQQNNLINSQFNQ